jgi:hypothetical protein
MGRHGRDHPIVFVGEESSNRKGFRKKWAIWESGEDGISLISLGRYGEWEDYKTKMSWTMYPVQNVFWPPGCHSLSIKGGHQRDQDDEGNREGSVVGYILYVFFQP